MTDDLVQIIIATYAPDQGADAAERALKALQTAKREQGIQVTDAAVVKRDAHGKLHIHETVDVTGGRGAAVGGILGGVLGILAGPGGVVAGVAVGALVGGAAASMFDTGIPHKRLTEIGQTLQPGGAALVILTEAGYNDFIQTLIGGAGVEIAAETMNAEAARQLGHDHDVALKALNTGEALADGGMVEVKGKEE